MNTIKTLIIEDQSEIRSDITTLLLQCPQICLAGESATVKGAIDITRATHPDLILLDIQLQDGSGFDFLKTIGSLSAKVVFLTAHDQYAIQAIKYGAFDYLLKPVDEEELLDVVQRVAATLSTEADRHFLVLSSAEYLQIVRRDDIVYCQSDSGYTTFYLANGKKVVTSQHLKFYADLLPASKFIRPHKSYLVNYEFIDRLYKNGNFILKDGTEIPVAARRKDSIREHISRL